MGKIKLQNLNYAFTGNATDQSEFEPMIHKADKGPFHSIKAVKTELAKWKIILPVNA